MRPYLLLIMLCLSISLYSQSHNSSFVHFESDSHSLDVEAQAQLSELLLEMETHSDFELEIIGHTDQDGSESYNEKLAHHRASTVSDYLISLGVSEHRLVSNWKGERELLSEATSNTAKQQNRRVEVKYSYSDYQSVDEMIDDMKEESSLQHYSLDNDNSLLIDLEAGGSVYIPKNAFAYKDGTPVEGEVKLEVSEAYRLTDFVAQNLSTESKGELLETGGMLYLNATVDGQEVELAENRNLEIIYPVSEMKEDMELFYMEETADGATTWVPAESPITSTQVKNNPVEVDLDPIINFDLGRVERPKAVFPPMPRRPSMEKRPFPPAESIYSEDKYETLYTNYENNLAAWKVQRPKYLAAEEAWQKVVDERLDMIRAHKTNLLEMEVRIKLYNAMRGISYMQDLSLIHI